MFVKNKSLYFATIFVFGKLLYCTRQQQFQIFSGFMKAKDTKMGLAFI